MHAHVLLHEEENLHGFKKSASSKRKNIDFYQRHNNGDKKSAIFILSPFIEAKINHIAQVY